MTPDADSANPAVGDAVSFTLDVAEVTLRRLGELAADLQGLLREIQTGYLPGGHVRWRVERITFASPLTLESRPISVDVPVTGLRDLSRVVSNGLKQLQQEPTRPAFFTDTALERARDVVTRVRRNDGLLSIDSTALDEHVVANVNDVLGTIITVIGSVEGRLEALNVHGTNRFFNVYDSLHGARIRCDFGHRIRADKVGAAAEHRVIVHGEVKYREDGEIVSVVARSLEVLPEEGSLPSADDVLGILG